MYQHDPRDGARNMPALTGITAAFLGTEAAGLPALSSAWLYAPGPSVSLHIASEGTAAYRDLQAWADAFGVGPVVRASRDDHTLLYARIKFTRNHIAYDVTATITESSLSPAIGNNERDGDGDPGQQEKAA